MENWQVNKVFYYEVNGRKFYNKSEAYVNIGLLLYLHSSTG